MKIQETLPVTQVDDENLSFFKAIGVDYAPAMCAEATRKAAAIGVADRAHFVTGDSENLPFADAAFDIITRSRTRIPVPPGHRPSA